MRGGDRALTTGTNSSRTTRSKWCCWRRPRPCTPSLRIQALAAGKHVVVETPMCLNVFEADALIAASRRTGRFVSVAHLRRWDDDFRTAAQVLSGGDLGRPVAIKFINCHYNPPALQLSHRTQARRRRRPAARPSAHAFASREAVCSGNSGSHCFDQLLQLAGRPAQSVFARMFPVPSGASVDDGFLAIVTFPGNLTAHVEVHRAAAAPMSAGWTIVGDRGSYADFTHFTPAPEARSSMSPSLPVAGERR